MPDTTKLWTVSIPKIMSSTQFTKDISSITSLQSLFFMIRVIFNHFNDLYSYNELELLFILTAVFGDLVENKSEFEQKAPQTYSLYDYMIDTIQNNAASIHTLKNLEKFSFYEIYVQPFYDHIVGKPSQSMRARTFEDGSFSRECLSFHRLQHNFYIHFQCLLHLQ